MEPSSVLSPQAFNETDTHSETNELNILWGFIAVFIVSSLGLLGLIFVFMKPKTLKRVLMELIALSIGALIGDAFIHIIPELFKEASEDDRIAFSMLILTGFFVSFILERAIGHHHHASSSELNIGQGEKGPSRRHRHHHRHHPHQHTEELITKDATDQSQQLGERTKDSKEQASPSRPETSTSMSESEQAKNVETSPQSHKESTQVSEKKDTTTKQSSESQSDHQSESSKESDNVDERESQSSRKSSQPSHSKSRSSNKSSKSDREHQRHHHTERDSHDHTHSSHSLKTFLVVILLGDLLHNFVDGIVVMASFLSSTTLGIATTLAVVLHEIPHEIGNFATFVHFGASQKKALIINIIDGSASIVGAALTAAFNVVIANFATYVLAFAAGNFIYVAASDLIPELTRKIYKRQRRLRIATQAVAIAFGIALMTVILAIESSMGH